MCSSDLLALALAMVLSLAACGGDNSSKQPGGDKKDDGQGSDKVYRIAMVTDSSITDGSWGTVTYNAMVDAATERGWQYECADAIAQSAYYDTFASYCDQGFDIVYAPGNQYTDAILEVAKEYPDVVFAQLNGSMGTPEKAENGNVMVMFPDSHEIGWTAGILAGLMTQTNTVAFIGAIELDTTQGKYAGFKESAEYVGKQEGKSVTVLDPVYSGDFNASDKGIEFAKALMDQGADVFFGDAGAVDSGARQAIDEHNTAAGKVEVYDIAQPADLLGQNECIICSQVTDNSSLVSMCMESVENGTFEGGAVYGTMGNGVLSAGKISDLVPKEIQDKYNAYLEQVKAGTFMK